MHPHPIESGALKKAPLSFEQKTNSGCRLNIQLKVNRAGSISLCILPKPSPGLTPDEKEPDGV